MRVVALIPAYNESDTIVATLKSVMKLDSLAEIVVINDGSTDNTGNLVQEQDGVTLLSMSQNQGKGAALNHGFKMIPAQVYLLLDADLGSTAVLAQALLEPILKDEADMTIARFGTVQSDSPKKMGFGLVRQVACLGVKILTGTWVTSPLSGQRAIKAEVLHTLGGFYSGFGVEVGLTVGALQHGYRILEVPLPMRHRAYGRGIKGMRHRFRQLVQVLGALWRSWRRGWNT